MWLEKFEFDEFDGSGEILVLLLIWRCLLYENESFKFAIFTSKRGRGINFEFQCSPAVLLGMLQI